MDTTRTVPGHLGDQKDSHLEENGRVDDSSLEQQPESERPRTLKNRIKSVLWDSFDKSPEERKFIAKIDWWILTYCCIAYFVKYLDQTNVSNILRRIRLMLNRLANSEWRLGE
jgi:hypothetical protein